MTIGFLFWLLFLLWLILGIYWNRAGISAGNYGVIGGNVILLILLFLLGWRVFGFPIQG